MGKFGHIVEAFERTAFTLGEVGIMSEAGENDWKRFLGAYDTVCALDAASVQEPTAGEMAKEAPVGAESFAVGEMVAAAGISTRRVGISEVHRPEVVTGASVATCCVCGKSCRSKAGLSAHMRHAHKVDAAAACSGSTPGTLKAKAVVLGPVRATKVHIHDGYTRPLTPPEMAGREI